MTKINEVTPPGIPDQDVKDMKPSFKKQYGDRWKSVLYATLWKHHNKNEDTRFEMINYIWENVHPSRKIEENQAILVTHPEQGRQARPLVEMSDDELEHHYMNIKMTKNELNEDRFAFVNRKGIIRKRHDHLDTHRRDGWEAFEKGKSPAANPHVSGTKHAHAWKQGYDGSKEYHTEEVIIENEGPKVVHIHYHPDYEEYRVPSGSKAKGAGYFTNDKEDAEATARHIHGNDIVIKHSRKRYNTEEYISEDAVDDQLAKHGMSRVKLQHNMSMQHQQHNGRLNPTQHPSFRQVKTQHDLVKSGRGLAKEAWAGDKSGENATNPKKKGMWDGYSLEDLHKARKSASGTRLKEIDFAIRSKTNWGKV